MLLSSWEYLEEIQATFFTYKLSNLNKITIMSISHVKLHGVNSDMEASESKWVNPILDIIWVNSLTSI